jgi:endo-1,4-beta-D-glucanase Y
VLEGSYTASFDESERQREKVTRKTGCKAFTRVKEKEDGTCVIKDFNTKHNHPLLLSPSMSVFLHSHKRVDSTLKDYIKDLLFNNIKHVNIMGLLTRLNGGRRNLPCHDKDVQNM